MEFFDVNSFEAIVVLNIFQLYNVKFQYTLLLLKGNIVIIFYFIGRCKSAFHEFLSDILELVADRVEVHGVKAKQMVLPHCTWDKFGELLAESGGRSLGLFDELMSFFSTMNMYSSHKLQISDTREYQDFLQLFTGKAKTRETGK